jgi:hypothetical protein
MSNYGSRVYCPLEFDDPAPGRLKLFEQANRIFTRESARDSRGQHR